MNKIEFELPDNVNIEEDDIKWIIASMPGCCSNREKVADLSLRSASTNVGLVPVISAIPSITSLFEFSRLSMMITSIPASISSTVVCDPI